MERLFDMAIIGKNISSLRKKNNLTQMELADQLFISYQAVSNWERGVTMPDISKLPELASIFGISVDEILQNEKGAQIIANLSEGKQMKSITADELLEVAPILRADQVDTLVRSVSTGFSPEQAERVIPLMAFEGAYESSNDELADQFYQQGSTAFFSILTCGLSCEKRQEIAMLAFADGVTSFFSILVPYLDDQAKEQFALQAYEENKIAFFSILLRHLSPDSRKYFHNRAVEEENIAFFAILRSK